MANTFFGLTIGQSGLYAANTSLNTTAHNVSNEQTKGYSRQQVNQQATRALSNNMRHGMIGSGVTITRIDQVRDIYYDYKYWANNSKLSEHTAKNYHMLKIEDYFNEMTTAGFTTEYGNFVNSLKTLKDDPAGVSSRNSVIGYAENILEYFEVIKSNLMNQQEDINEEVKDKVDQINTLAADIAALNRQINTVELTGEKANDLRDRRALLVDELSGVVEVSVSETFFDNNKTEYKVMIGGNAVVDNFNAFELKVETRDVRKHSTDAVGLYNIKWSWGDSFNPVYSGYEGELKAILEVRDGSNGVGEAAVNYKGVPYYMAEVNSFLETFTTKFNEIHSQGYNHYGDKIADLEDADFFVVVDGKYQVNEKYIKDPMLMALSTEPIQNGVENVGILDKLIDLQNEPNYDGGLAGDFLQTLVSELGIDTRKSSNMVQNYTVIGESISNKRISISGVDKDEETTNLLKYQEAYELAAKVISIMNEIYNTLIRETGV